MGTLDRILRRVITGVVVGLIVAAAESMVGRGTTYMARREAELGHE